MSAARSPESIETGSGEPPGPGHHRRRPTGRRPRRCICCGSMAIDHPSIPLSEPADRDHASIRYEGIVDTFVR